MMFFFHKRKGDHVDIGIKDSAKLGFPSFDTLWHSAVYADNLNSITWPEAIHVVIVG